MSLLRTTMAVLSRAAPGVATSLFDRIWFTAPRTRPRAEAAAWLARGEAVEYPVHGRTVRAWAWGRGPTVVLLHGWGGHAGQMHALLEPLLARGLRVVALDAPAHGASAPSRLGGQRVSMLEIADALRVVAAAQGPLAGLVAHSGGCTATALALRDGWPGPDRIAFIAPFALPSRAIAPFGRAIGASAQVIERFRDAVARRFARPWTDFDIPGLARRRALPPLLVVHDRDDRDVPWQHGAAVAAAWPGTARIDTRGLGHRRVLRDPGVIAQVAEFLAAGHRPAPAPTPADARGELDAAYATCGLAPPVTR
ncbi:alpha/beta fold hydrolase [Luteimonas kalidii]|uniref:Alpha/beta fold hydrolase n=1 Tax=Luteimonas kalidii TaxID=3042025 RepID=A0ABT6JU14_9GAMM|nr:alpha/beta fold hydrolase [Luteimonas kalidii]MDH5833641.1 alpha/beta fold hydrolase [Luteimonas kalidii]